MSKFNKQLISTTPIPWQSGKSHVFDRDLVMDEMHLSLPASAEYAHGKCAPVIEQETGGCGMKAGGEE